MTEKRPVHREELLIGGLWTDISSFVHMSPGGDTVAITRGRPNEGSSAEPSTCTLSLNNSDGRFSPRNPTGAYYGSIGRNTPLRVRVPSGTTNTLVCTGQSTSSAQTPDNAALDIPQDVDARAEFILDSFAATAGLIGKGVLGTTMAYQLLVGFTKGVPHLTWRWSPDGTTTRFVDHELPELQPGVRIAVRVTHQGAAGDITFYTATSIGGTWTQHGTVTHLAPVLSIFNSADPLYVGTRAGVDPFLGSIRAIELRNGVGGTVVANPDFTAQTPGVTSFNDAAGRAWTINAGASIGLEYVTRFIGEVAAWPQQWSPVGSDVYCQVQAAGVLRRIGQGQSPQLVGPKTFVTSKRFDQCWPCDTPISLSSIHTPLVANGCAATVHFGQGVMDDGFPAGVLIDTTSTVTGNYFPANGYLSGYVGAGQGGSFEAAGFVFKCDQLGDIAFYLNAYVLGAHHSILFDHASQTVSLYAATYDPDLGYTLHAVAVSAALPVFSDGLIHSLLVTLVQGIGQLTCTIYIDGASVASGTDTFTTSLGGISGLQLTYAPDPANVAGLAMSYLTVWSDQFNDQTLPDPVLWAQAANGYIGETAGRRIQRVCSENGLPAAFIGDLDDTVPMGPMGTSDLVTLLSEAADTDGGILSEPRAILGIAYRTRKSMYNQAADITIDYTAGVLGAAPDVTDDDQTIRNDVTISRAGGGSARDTQTSGALSTQAPPNGIGQYATSATVNVATDGLLPDQASWRLALGTIDAARFPSLPLNLMNPAIANNPALRAAALAVDVGDLALLQHLPAWLPPDDVALLAQGYGETLAIDAWDLTFNCAPEQPYEIARYGASQGDPTGDRYDAENATMTSGTNTTATSFQVSSAANTQLWTVDAAAFPFDVLIAGERMTVTNITGSSSPQTFTVTRSVNGVVKTHVTGEPVRLFKTPRYGL